MKKTDVALIVLIAGVSMLIAFFVANSIPALKTSNTGVKVDTVERISSDIDEPDPAIFNAEALNPTVETVIGAPAPETP